MSRPVCEACGAPDLKLIGRKNGEFILREFTFHQCGGCGFMWVEPFSGFAIYNDAYYRGKGPDPYVDYESEYQDWQRSDRALEFDDMARLAQKFFVTARPAPPAAEPPPPIAWLDFGCGAGGFLKYLRARGSLHGRPLELTGHDVGSYAELLKTREGFRILDWDELSRESTARYDVISLIEVIEHLPSPLEPLALAARLLKPGGLLLLTTGNLDSLIARRQGIHYRYCAPEIHVSLFNPACLAALYRRVGLSPCRVRYHGAVKFKVLKTLRLQPRSRRLARLALRLPPVVRLVDWLYGVSAMPCAVKPPQ
jgi:SAM-dependent methyltransferase